MNSPFDPNLLLPFQIGFGFLLGYILYDFFNDSFPPDDDCYA